MEGNNPKLSDQNFTLGGTFEFAAPSQAQTLTGIFSGAGTNILAGGALTLSGASTYAGDTVLNGGEVIVYGAENPGTSGLLGVGTIDFNGDTLGFSVNNAIDYSSRFNTAAPQANSFDTGGHNVTVKLANSKSFWALVADSNMQVGGFWAGKVAGTGAYAFEYGNIPPHPVKGGNKAFAEGWPVGASSPTCINSIPAPVTLAKRTRISIRIRRISMRNPWPY